MNIEDEGNRLALRARSSARYFYKNNDSGKAFANFLLALNIRRDWSPELEPLFSQILCDWGNTLEKTGKFSDLFTCYEEALKIYPSSPVILNNLGAHLLRLNHANEACQYFRECLTVDQLYLPAQRNLENVSNSLVERWHFRMLNDTNRNDCYRRAIHSAVKKGDTVLDIGTGTGLLSLFAAECEARMIFACDYSEVMASLATEIIEKNNCSKLIKVINKCSDDLQIPNDLPERVDIVVTEIMDAGLFGEGLLQSLDAAWDKLIKPSSSLKYKRQRVIPRDAVLFIAPVECLYLAKKFKHIRDSRIENKFEFDFELVGDLKEPYDCEDLNSVEFKYLSKPKEVLYVDFNDPSDVKKNLNNEFIEVTIDCHENGYLDALIVWFQLNLDESSSISTRPSAEKESCWQQAVFQIGKNIPINKESQIKLKLSCAAGKLFLLDYAVSDFDSTVHNYSKVSIDFVRFLNNRSCLKQYDKLIENLKLNKDKLNVLELSIYPYVGLKLVSERLVNLTSFHLDKLDAEFLQNNLKEKSLSLCNFYQMDSVLDYLKQDLKLDLIILELLNSDGELNDSLMNLYPTLRCCMNNGCFIFPSQVRIHCQLIYSDWLNNNSRLRNRGTTSLLQEFNGFDSLNDFKVNRFIDLNINKLKQIKISDKLTAAVMDLEGIFSCCLQEFTVNTKASQDGLINAILYWFSYGHDDIIISSDLEDFHRNQGAEILSTPLNVKKGDNLAVTLHYMSCITHFNIHAF